MYSVGVRMWAGIYGAIYIELTPAIYIELTEHSSLSGGQCQKRRFSLRAGGGGRRDQSFSLE
jgi:hypothetical protein